MVRGGDETLKSGTKERNKDRSKDTSDSQLRIKRTNGYPCLHSMLGSQLISENPLVCAKKERMSGTPPYATRDSQSPGLALLRS